MRGSLLLIVSLIGVSGAATAQEIVAPEGGNRTGGQPVVNTVIPPGAVVHDVIQPSTPQPPGTAIAFVPEGTPAVVTPYTSLTYAPAAASRVVGGALQQPTMVEREANGGELELDSDNTVHQLFPDGSKVTALSGIHRMADGSTVVVKNGMRVQ